MQTKYNSVNLEDNELLVLMKKGNHLAFDQIYKKYWKRLYVYAYKIFGDEHACEDVVQEVFIKLWQNIADSDIRNLESYLFKAIKHRISNNIRRIKWTTSHDESLNELASDNKSEAHIEVKELQLHIENSIQLLPSKCQEVFRLSREAHLSNQEIADRLNISIRTVENHIHQALKLLRSKMPSSTLAILMLAGLVI